MAKKLKFKITDIVPGVLAALAYAGRHIKFYKVYDFGDFGKSYISFTQKLETCSKPLIGKLDTCSGIATTNTIWWVVIGLLVLVQLFFIYKRFIKK